MQDGIQINNIVGAIDHGQLRLSFRSGRNLIFLDPPG
jgi:hypothetical protein